MLLQMKNGTEVLDSRLGRVPFFDPRSKNFAIRSLYQEPKRPRSYTWECEPKYDQGYDGACVLFALGHELAARPSKVQGLTNKRLTELYWEAQKIDYWPGGEYPGAYPVYGGTSVIAGVKVLQKLGYFEEYRWAWTLEDLVLGVGRNGPAVVGVNWYEGMFETDADGYIHIFGRLAGGHAVLVRGVDIKRRRFLIRNSWSHLWGMDGDCWITFEDMQRLLWEDGEAVFLLNRRTVPRPLAA